jgi:hypothetical protein
MNLEKNYIFLIVQHLLILNITELVLHRKKYIIVLFVSVSFLGFAVMKIKQLKKFNTFLCLFQTLSLFQK